jgi:predicted DNA-binding transcriptional regulator AlpA
MTRWIDAEAIARMLGYEVRVVRERLAKKPGFPVPMRVNGTGHPRWRVDEVERWAESQREAA